MSIQLLKKRVTLFRNIFQSVNISSASFFLLVHLPIAKSVGVTYKMCSHSCQAHSLLLACCF